MPEDLFRIAPARSGDDMKAASALFEAYAAALGVDLAFQDFSAELAALPSKYAPPEGELLLARGPSGQPLGCVAFRPIAPAGCCEMKRLYVAPDGRGRGLGDALVQAAVAAAARIGYREMRLDTLPTMEVALALYLKAGFAPIGAYYDTPIPDTVFLARPLAPPIAIGP